MPPEATGLIRSRFGQDVIEAYGQRGVTFREEERSVYRRSLNIRLE